MSRLRYTFITANYDEIDEIIDGLRKNERFESLCEEFFQDCHIDSRGSLVPPSFFTDDANSTTLLYAMYELLGSSPDTFLLKHRVSRVKILRRDFRGHFKFPKGLLSLPLLKVLIIRNMGISQLPESFSEVGSLRILDLSGNILTKIPPPLLKLTDLSALNLSYNSLEDMPEKLGQLKSLRILSLRGNRITQMTTEWHHLQFLRKLDVSMNRISSIPDSLLSLATLQDIKLSYNDLDASAEAEWEKRIHEGNDRDGIQGTLELG